MNKHDAEPFCPEVYPHIEVYPGSNDTRHGIAMSFQKSLPGKNGYRRQLMTDLCEPLDPFEPHGIVYQKQHNVHGFNIALRPLLLPADLPLLRKWVMREYIKPFLKMNTAFNLVLQTLLDEARSNKAQVLTVLLENKPVCEVELAHAVQDEISHYYQTKPGDFTIRFLAPFFKTNAIYSAIVQTCCEYLTLYPEVKRVIAPVNEKNSKEIKLLEKSGFRLLQQVVSRYKILNLYATSVIR
jgi:RimJ/RimL family protein N-acetyltransferase